MGGDGVAALLPLVAVLVTRLTVKVAGNQRVRCAEVGSIQANRSSQTLLRSISTLLPEYSKT